METSPPVELGSSGWGNMTLIAPGMINGNLVLWATDNTSGNLYSYTFSIDADQVPTLALLSPSHTVGSPVTAEGAAATPIPVSVDLSATNFPVIASNGDDATGSAPNLYFIGTSGNVWELAGVNGASNDSAPFTQTQAKIQIGTVTALSIKQLS